MHRPNRLPQVPVCCPNAVSKTVVIALQSAGFVGILAVLLIVFCGCGTSSETSSLSGERQALARSATPLSAVDSQRIGGLPEAAGDAPNGVELNTETYDSIQENPFVEALSQPQSTFAVDVDTASYANVRRMISSGQLPPAGAVRLEELVNYFNYDYPEPSEEHPFSVTTECAPCPWNSAHELLRVGLKGRSIEFENRRPCNLVFLLDVSGSMSSPSKLPLVQSAMKLLVEELGEQDRIAMVVYAGASGLVLPSTPVAKANDVLGAIDHLRAGGSTNGGEGIELAYRIAEENFVDGGVNRVILCTDGDFNVGVTNQSDLVTMIENKAKSNVFLSVLGFGSGNLKDSTMEKLADKGNGNYAYIDSMLEARKVLVEEIGATLVTIAKDVKIQVDFNPQHVRAYRLIGYENRLLENQDFRDDSKDAGEIGAGHSVTAFYELLPNDEVLASSGSSDVAIDSRDSEFVKNVLSENADSSTKLTVNLRYKQPDAEESQEFQVRLASDADVDPSSDFRFASAVVGYGMLLRSSDYAEDLDWDWVIDTASSSSGNDRRGLRAEFVQLAKTARRLIGTTESTVQ